MPKYEMVCEKECPHCGSPLDHIIEERTVKEWYSVTPDTDYEPNGEYDFNNEYDFNDSDITSSHCYCPDCEGELSEDFFREEIKEEIINPKEMLLNAIKN